MEKKAKQWCVRAVPFGRSLKKYAKDLEEVLNELSGEGRMIQINQVREIGVTVIGHLPEQHPQTQPFPGVAAMLMGQLPQDPDQESVSPTTRRLVAPMLSAAETASDPELDKLADRTVAQFPAEMIRQAISECEKVATLHEKSHADDPSSSCTMSRDMNRVLRHLKKSLNATIS